ncbi:glycogen synthase GlgA [bacterium]|nr:glycogen synthase GlgA [bacterium]MCI0606910.1 glycogen synthase GlgA [bacterium]
MLKIALVASEAVPVAKTGGLGDVVSALGKELVKLGNQVTLMMPLYGNFPILPTGLISPLRLTFAGRQVTYSIVEALYEGMKLILIDSPQYFQRGGIYGDSSGGYSDNDERFLFFTRACLEYFRRKGEPPDIFHCNDWPTGLFPLFLRTHYYHDPISKTPVLFTIHNIAYQGNFSGSRFSLLELGPEYFTPESLEFYTTVSFLKAGLLYSDLLTTVSPRHSKEIQTDEYGCKMQGVLRMRKDRLFGVLNGIDEKIWNPETDAYIARNFSCIDLSGKAECKRNILAEAGLEANSDWPVVAMISRLALQKGIDLVEAAADRILDSKAFLIVLGTGGARYERFFEKLRSRRPNQVSIALRFDEAYAHRLEAGADMFLMPSRYEPCGLNQMYSLKYGTVPLVRATGGLEDTVQEWDQENQAGNGFKFGPYKSEALVEAFARARKAFEDKRMWKRMMQNGMRANFSWKNSALRYMSLYDQALQLKS